MSSKLKKVKDNLFSIIDKVHYARLKHSKTLKYTPVIALITITIVFGIFYYLFNVYTPVVRVENNGYMLKGNSDIENLKKNIDKLDTKLDTVKVNENDYIYKNNLNNYLDDSKKNVVDIEYPLFINDGLSIVNYNDKVNLINKTLDRSIGYKNLVMSYGTLYNINDYTQVDLDKYLLLSYSNGIFINLYDLKITTMTNEYIIPVNSFIYFSDDVINYYKRDNNRFIKDTILGVESVSTVEFYYESSNESYKFNYEDFTKNIGVSYIEKITVPDKPIINIEDQKEEIIEDTIIEKEIDTFKWEKPTVILNSLSSNVYSVKGEITINDPAGVITKMPTFTFITNDKTFLRKTVSNTGEFTINGLLPDTEFEVIGEYTYLNKDLETKTVVTFYYNNITTKGLDTLEPIKIEFENGEISPKRINLSSLKIVSSLDSETIKGIKNCGISIDGETYYISKNELMDLIKGKTLDSVSTSDNLKPKTNYDFEVNFYDQLGNKIPALNNTGKSRTCANFPTTSLKIIKTEVDNVTIGLSLKNTDNVIINNYRYTVLNSSGKVVSSGEINDSKLNLRDLDPNQLFQIIVYGDFDIDDGHGIYKNYEMGSMTFSALSISSLGYFNFYLETTEITSDSVSINYKINTKTDTRLLNILNDLTLKVYTYDGKKLVDEHNFTKQELEKIKNREQSNISFNSLDSNTKYIFKFESTVKQGETVDNVESMHNLDYFETKKKSAQVILTNSLTTSNTIDFDARVVDTDYAIEAENVRMELRTANGTLIDIKNIGINLEDSERFAFNNLNIDQDYTLTFIADGYNETNSNTTYEYKHELLKLTFHTDEGISGKLELISSLREPTGENLVDVNSEVKWMLNANYHTPPKTVDEEGHMHIYAKGAASSYAYDLSDYQGEFVTATFKIKAINPLPKDYKIYFTNYLNGSTAHGIELKDVKTDEWTSFSYSYKVGYRNVNNNYIYCGDIWGKGQCDYATFYMNNALNDASEYEIKDFEIHISKDKKEMDIGNGVIEEGSYSANGTPSKGNNNNYVRYSEPILLEANNIYSFEVTSDDPNDNLQSMMYFTDLNNNAKGQPEGWWFTGERSIYITENLKAHLFIRSNDGNTKIDLSKIKFKLSKTTDRGIIGYKNFKSELISKVRINLSDKRNEVANDTYYINVIDNDSEYEKVYSFKELVDNNNNNIENVIKNLDLEPDKNYTIQLYVLVRDRKYILDSFDISTNTEVKGIMTQNDWYYIQHNGNYILLNDLSLIGFNPLIGSSTREFNGTMDFQGYTVTAESKTQSIKFVIVGKNGVLKNLVLDYRINNEANNNSMPGFVQKNNGLIENIKVNVTDERPSKFNDKTLGVIVANNYGTIRNFVVKLDTKVNLYENSSLVAINNYGTIENGYTYGENVEVTNETSNVNFRSVSLINVNGTTKSVIQNVYVLNSIEFPNNYSYDTAGLISSNTNGIVRNVYTVGETSNINQERGPIVGNYNAKILLSNAYYKSKYTYTTNNQTKISNIDLNSVDFQKTALKSGFDIDDMIKLGYYPQVIYSSNKMPKQEFIPLPEYNNDSLEIVSMEVKEKTNNSALINVVVDNPDGSEISNITISDLTTNIQSQRYEDGKSYVELEVYNPSIYQSKYAVRSISSTTYTGITVKKQYNIGEKYLYIDFYHEINSVEEWIKINNNTRENYIIMNDLDFSEYVNYRIIYGFVGKIDGNNYTLKNMNLQSSLFSNMNGTLENINFENINIDLANNNTGRAGIIDYTSQGKFNNIHINNIKITLSGETTQEKSVGALIGGGQYSNISNCSASNVTIKSTATGSKISVGGLIGTCTNNNINNVFTENVYIDVKGALGTYGIGGILGAEFGTAGIIEAAYSTGYISSNTDNVGGIAGKTSSFVEYTYSIANVSSGINNIGGIVGYTGYPNNIINNIFAGSLYATTDNGINGKIIGNSTADSSNYSLDSSLVNGQINNFANGETVVTSGDLLNVSSYKEIGFDNYYDISKVSEGILPKVYGYESTEILAYQSDLTIPGDTFKVDYINISKSLHDGVVAIQFSNLNNYIIDDIEVEGMDIEITKNNFVDNISVIEFNAVPNKFYDSYKLSKIKYHVAGEENIREYSTSVKLDMRFYKELSSYDDWQQVSTYDPENYILTNDIDFTDKNFNTKVVFNRLEGDSNNPPTISGMHISYNSTSIDNNFSIISCITTSIKNVNFNDISIINSKKSNNYNFNIINSSYGEMENVKFSNITLDLNGCHHLGIILYGYNSSIKNIILDNINVNGKYYLSGFIAQYYPNDMGRTINNIDAKNITITGTESNYIGGIFAQLINGFDNGSEPITNISIKDSSITATNSSNVGGIAGQGIASNSTVTNTIVSGRDNVGGAFGSTVAHGHDISVINSEISGSGNKIGGISGSNATIKDCLVKDSTITGTSVNSTYVGGLIGYHSSTTYRNVVENSRIINNGTKTGGIAGVLFGGNFYSYSVNNSTITGRRCTGGIAGEFYNATLQYGRVTDSTINSTDSYAGGMVGNISNTNNETTVDKFTLRDIIVGKTNVSSSKYAGGFIGGKNDPIPNPTSSFNLYFEGNITSSDGITAGAGSGDSSNSEMIGLRWTGFYENSTINGVKLKNMVSDEYETNLITETNSGVLSSIDGTPGTNASYPYASYTNLIKFEAGQTYRIRAVLNKTTNNNNFRIYLYDINGDYVGDALSSTNLANYLGKNISLSSIDEIVLTPIYDCYVRIQYYNQVHDNDVMKLKSNSSYLISDKLLSLDELRNESTWHTGIGLYKFIYVKDYFDFSVMNSHIDNFIVTDKSGKNHTARGSTDMIGKNGAYFNGETSYITVDDFTLPNNFTFVANVTPTRIRRDSYIFSYRDETTRKGIGVYLVDNKLVFITNDKVHTSNCYFILNKNNNIVITLQNRKYLKVYENGTLTLNYSYNVELPAGNYKTYIGHDISASSTNYAGYIKNIAIYNRILNQSEVNNNYSVAGITDTSGLELFYDFTDLDYDSTGYYPILKWSTSELTVKEQKLVPLPKEDDLLGTSSMMLPNSIGINKLANTMISDNDYHVYSTGVNTINIEFDNISSDLYFTYKTNGVDERIKVDKRVYSMYYDYNSDIELTLETTFDSKNIVFTKDNLAKTVNIIGDNYYYIRDNKLYNKGELLCDNVVHLYNNLALTSDGRVYNLDTNNYQNMYISKKVLSDSIPLYHSVMNNKNVDVYYNFSIITDDSNQVIRNEQVILKDNKMHAYTPLVNNDNSKVLVNTYNGKEYQIALGLDNKLYSYKEEIKYDGVLINGNITDINYDFNSNNPVIIIKYNNGKVVVFDYSNGNILYEDGDNSYVSLFTYLNMSLSANKIAVNNSDYIANKKTNAKLSDITDQDILDLLNVNNSKKAPSQEIVLDDTDIHNEVIDNTIVNDYIITYNETTNKYEAYSTNDILDTDKEEIESISYKISNNQFLNSYFNSNKSNELFKNNKVFIYIGIIIIILLNLGYLKLRTRKEV